jgi:integrase
MALSPANVAVLKQQLEYQKGLRRELNPTAKEKDLIKDNDLIFSHFDGSPLLPNSISHAWHKQVKKCGLKDIRLHDSRHSMATLLFKMGVHPKVV